MIIWKRPKNGWVIETLETKAIKKDFILDLFWMKSISMKEEVRSKLSNAKCSVLVMFIPEVR